MSQDVVTLEAGANPAVTAKADKKKLTNVKTNLGMMIINNDVYFGAHLQCTVTDANSNAFSAFLSKSESSDTPDSRELINTIIVYDPSTSSISEVSDESSLKWFKGESKEFHLPSFLNQEFKDAIVADMKKVKSCLSTYEPIPDKYQDLLSEDPLIASAMQSILDNGASLTSSIKILKKSTANVDLAAFIDRYAFKQHIMLMGPRGMGKTYRVTEYADSHHASVVQLNGHKGIEAIDILGYNVRHNDGNFIWLDGPLTEAFRKAQTEQVILIVDEFLRIPTRELNIFIASLTPNSKGEFILNTSRITDVDTTTGIGKSETLRIPKENLWVVATTNVGSDYDVDDMDLALSDRFKSYDVFLTDSEIFSILNSANNKSFSDTVLSSLFNVYKAVNASVGSQQLAYTMNTRHVTGILQNVDDVAEIKSYLFDLAPNICSRDTNGKLNQAELDIFKEIIKANF